jgi:hypothetical protein
MAGYFPHVMGKAPLLWLDNLPTECITSWATLSRLFTTNYQATYNRPSNTHHLARVRMRSDATLREYTNRYFENRNTLAGVKDDDVIAYYKKGITNVKLFEKIHEADARTIGDLMAYVDKLVDTQDAVMHDFNGEDVTYQKFDCFPMCEFSQKFKTFCLNLSATNQCASLSSPFSKI